MLRAGVLPMGRTRSIPFLHGPARTPSGYLQDWRGLIQVIRTIVLETNELINLPKLETSSVVNAL